MIGLELHGKDVNDMMLKFSSTHNIYTHTVYIQVLVI